MSRTAQGQDTSPSPARRPRRGRTDGPRDVLDFLDRFADRLRDNSWGWSNTLQLTLLIIVTLGLILAGLGVLAHELTGLPTSVIGLVCGGVSVASAASYQRGARRRRQRDINVSGQDSDAAR